MSILWFTIFPVFRFWRSLYNRYIDNVHPKESIVDRVCSLNDHNDSLRDHIRFLEKVNHFFLLLQSWKWLIYRLHGFLLCIFSELSISRLPSIPNWEVLTLIHFEGYFTFCILYLGYFSMSNSMSNKLYCHLQIWDRERPLYDVTISQSKEGTFLKKKSIKNYCHEEMPFWKKAST